MLNKMLYQVTAQCSSRISFLFHFISSHSILFSFFYNSSFSTGGLFFGRFRLLSIETHIHSHMWPFIIFHLFSFHLLSWWNCCRLCFIVELDHVLVLVRSFLSSHLCVLHLTLCVCVSRSIVSLWTVSGPNFKYNPGSLTYPIRFVMYSCLPFG